MAEKQTKAQEKTKAKDLEPSKMMRLAINNRQVKAKIGSFKAILSNLITNKKNKNEIILLLTAFVNSTILLELANSSY